MRISDYAEQFTKDRKQVSTGKWLIDGLVTYLLAGSIAYMVYSLNEGRFENAGLLAVGGTLAMFVFISQSEKKAGPIMWLLTKVFVVCWLVLEVASIAGSYMSASNGHELNQYRNIKESAQNKISAFNLDKADIQNSNVSDAVKIYRKSEINAKITSLENEANLIIDSNEGKYFDDLSKLTGIDNIGQIYQITLSALLVLAGSMLISLRNGIWCNLTLNWHLKQSAETLKIMAGCELTETENDTATDDKTQGLEGEEPKRKAKSCGDYEAAKKWVESEFINGGYIGAKALKKATGTTSPHQQTAIISELIKNKVIERKGPAVKKYYRTDAKQSALNEMRKTASIFSIYKGRAV